MRILGYAVIERAREWHNSRILSLRFGDANTKFFHRKARNVDLSHDRQWMGPLS